MRRCLGHLSLGMLIKKGVHARKMTCLAKPFIWKLADIIIRTKCLRGGGAGNLLVLGTFIWRRFSFVCCVCVAVLVDAFEEKQRLVVCDVYSRI